MAALCVFSGQLSGVGKVCGEDQIRSDHASSAIWCELESQNIERNISFFSESLQTIIELSKECRKLGYTLVTDLQDFQFSLSLNLYRRNKF